MYYVCVGSIFCLAPEYRQYFEPGHPVRQYFELWHPSIGSILSPDARIKAVFFREVAGKFA
jgi:hypothetical protein